MNLAVYCGDHSGSIRQLEAIIEDIGSKHEVSVYKDLSALRRRLNRPGKHPGLIVLNAADRNDLEDMLLLEDLLRNIRLFIIVPDLDEITVSLAHRLHPRFLAHADADWDEFRAILSNMVRLYGQDSYFLPSVG